MTCTDVSFPTAGHRPTAQSEPSKELTHGQEKQVRPARPCKGVIVIKRHVALCVEASLGPYCCYLYELGKSQI